MNKYLNKKISTPMAIGIILILVILVGSFTWWQYRETRKDEANVPEVKLPEKEDKITDWGNNIEESISEVINEIVPDKFSKEIITVDNYAPFGARYKIEDLNNDESEEIIIITSSKETIYNDSSKREIFIGIVTILDKDWNYKLISDLIIEGNGEATPLFEFKELDGDVSREMILTFKGFSYHGSEGRIFDIDLDGQEIRLIEIKDENDEIHKTYYSGGASYGRNYLNFEDINGDDKEELIKEGLWFTDKEPENLKSAKTKEYEERWQYCQIVVYKWDGTYLTYSKELSDLILDDRCKGF